MSLCDKDASIQLRTATSVRGDKHTHFKILLLLLKYCTEWRVFANCLHISCFVPTIPPSISHCSYSNGVWPSTRDQGRERERTHATAHFNVSLLTCTMCHCSPAQCATAHLRNVPLLTCAMCHCSPAQCATAHLRNVPLLTCAKRTFCIWPSLPPSPPFVITDKVKYR